MGRPKKDAPVAPAEQTPAIITTTQFMGDLQAIISQIPAVQAVLVKALNNMAADTGKNVVEYLAAAAGLVSVDKDQWVRKPQEEKGE